MANYKNSGLKRTALRKKLDQTDLEQYLLKGLTLKQIAEKFKTSIFMVQTVLTLQLKKRNIGFDPLPPVVLETEGAWINSQQRKNYLDFKYQFLLN